MPMAQILVGTASLAAKERGFLESSSYYGEFIQWEQEKCQDTHCQHLPPLLCQLIFTQDIDSISNVNMKNILHSIQICSSCLRRQTNFRDVNNNVFNTEKASILLQQRSHWSLSTRWQPKLMLFGSVWLQEEQFAAVNVQNLELLPPLNSFWCFFYWLL